MIKINAAIGRMQPFTTGHLKLALNTYKQTGLKTVYFIIDTTKADERHPFLTKMMWQSFKNIARHYDEIADFLLVKNADIMKMGEAAAAKGYTISTWSCGTDRYDAYKKMCAKYAPDVEVIEIHRTDSDVSATAVRDAIRKGDVKSFEEMTPSEEHKLFDKMKDALSAVE